MCELNVSTYVGERASERANEKKEKNRKEKARLEQHTHTRVWLVVMMMMVVVVCERRAHSWSVSCPSSPFLFFPSLLFSSLRRCPLRPYTYAHSLTHQQLRPLIRIFSLLLLTYASAQAAGHEARVRLFFPFLSLSLSRSFARSPCCCCCLLRDLLSSNMSALPTFSSVVRRRRRKNRRQTLARLHQHI